MGLVEVAGIADVELAHKVAEVASRCLHKQLKRPVHQHETKKFNPMGGGRLFKRIEKTDSIPVTSEDMLPAGALMTDPVYGAGVLHSQRSGHNSLHRWAG